MKKTLILAAAILATSVLHASATTATPSISAVGAIHIPHGQYCGEAKFASTLTPTDEYAFTSMRGTTTTNSITGSHVDFVANEPGYSMVKVCLAQPASHFVVHGLWVNYVVIALAST